MYTASRGYPGLGIAPVIAVKIGVDVGQKIAQALGGHLTANQQKHAQEVVDHYAAAVNGDSSALQWLYEKSGGLDPTGVNINFNKYTGRGWKPQDFQGNLQGAMLATLAFRSLTYDYYVDAASKAGAQVGQRGAGAISGESKLVNTAKMYLPTVATLTQQQAAQQPKTQQASLFGLDLSNPMTLLAPIGLLAAAFIFKDR